MSMSRIKMLIFRKNGKSAVARAHHQVLFLYQLMEDNNLWAPGQGRLVWQISGGKQSAAHL